MSDEPSPSNPAGLSGEGLLQYIGEVAEQLVHDLEQAEELTRRWRDAEQTFDLVQAAMRGCLGQLSATECWGEANRLPSSVLWQIAKVWLEVGTLQLRARTKPRGYAGDFEMLEKICSGFLCGDPLGNAFDRFFQSQAAPQAVRNRTALIADSLVKFVRERPGARTHVVSFGCGPAIDIRRALQQLAGTERQNVGFSLIDMDPLALDRASRRLEILLEEGRLRCIRDNLLRMVQRGKIKDRLGEVDFLFCSGLFDYLDDQTVVTTLSEFWDCLSLGGELLVFNFGPANTSRDYMEWIGNWYLIYRDAQTMMDLAKQAHLDDHGVVVVAEETGANLYWQVRKSS